MLYFGFLIYSFAPFILYLSLSLCSPPLSVFSLLNPYLCLIIKLFPNYPLLPSLRFIRSLPSCPPSKVSSVEVALLIGISICGICSFPPSLFLSPSLPRSVCAWPDAAWQVLRPTSIFHTNTTHTQLCIYTYSSFPKMFVHGAHRSRGWLREGGV